MTLYNEIQKVIDLAEARGILRVRTITEQIRIIRAHAQAMSKLGTDTTKSVAAKLIGNLLMALIVLAEMYGINVLDCLAVAFNAREREK